MSANAGRAQALAPSPRSPPASPDALLLAKRVVSSYQLHMGGDLCDEKDPAPEAVFKAFWLHPAAIVCWVVKVRTARHATGNGVCCRSTADVRSGVHKLANGARTHYAVLAFSLRRQAQACSLRRYCDGQAGGELLTGAGCVQASPEYTFANKAGLDILGTSIHELAGVDWNKSMDEDGRKVVYAASSQVLQQVGPSTAHRPCPGAALKNKPLASFLEMACLHLQRILLFRNFTRSDSCFTCRAMHTCRQGLLCRAKGSRWGTRRR